MGDGEDVIRRKKQPKPNIFSDEDSDGMRDGEDVIRRKKKHMNSSAFGDEDDEITNEYDVVVCDQVPDGMLYRMAFPCRKKDPFNPHNNPRFRYKKNVRMMEMRLSADTSSGSFDKVKADRLAQCAPQSVFVKSEPGLAPNLKSDEIFEGRAFVSENPFQSALGFIRDNTFFIAPLSGNFEMARSLAHMNKGKSGKDDDDTEESDAEGAAGQQVRVKFSRPETERQKKRREASALYREKQIANDPWINLTAHLKGDDAVAEQMEHMMTICDEKDDVKVNQMTQLELMKEGIICLKKQELTITRGDQILSQQTIRNLPKRDQVKAQVIKACVIKTSDVARLVDPSITRTELIEALQVCAHLVCGVWVLKSDYLFHGLPPASSNQAGKVDEYRMDMWRTARDFALCLLDGGAKVTRAVLKNVFSVNNADAEEILKTFGVQDFATRSWKLKIEPDVEFMTSDENLAVVVQEKEFWCERWASLRKHFEALSPPSPAPRPPPATSSAATTSTPSSSVAPIAGRRQRRNSGRASANVADVKMETD